MRIALTLIICALCCVGCLTQPQPSKLTTDQRHDLTEAVSNMAFELSNGRTPESDQEFPRAVWPSEVQRLHPVTMYCYHGDVVIALKSGAHEETGLYVVPRTGLRSVSYTLPSGSEWSFRKLIHESLYEYQRVKVMPNQGAAANVRPAFPFGVLGDFGYGLCEPLFYPAHVAEFDR